MIYTHHEIVEMHGGLSRVERPSVQDHATYERKDQAPVCPHFLISLSLNAQTNIEFYLCDAWSYQSE